MLLLSTNIDHMKICEILGAYSNLERVRGFMIVCLGERAGHTIFNRGLSKEIRRNES